MNQIGQPSGSEFLFVRNRNETYFKTELPKFEGNGWEVVSMAFDPKEREYIVLLRKSQSAK